DYDSHTQPKLTNRRIQMDAQTRRRERRAEKQAQWKADRILASTFRRNATKRHY
ncbi:antitermination protein N, partial [Escherichia coli]|nr:antitermination protein [Escherichia coli]